MRITVVMFMKSLHFQDVNEQRTLKKKMQKHFF